MSIHPQPRRERWREPVPDRRPAGVRPADARDGLPGPRAVAGRCATMPACSRTSWTCCAAPCARRTSARRRRPTLPRRPLVRRGPPGLRQPRARPGGHPGDGGGARRLPASRPLPRAVRGPRQEAAGAGSAGAARPRAESSSISAPGPAITSRRSRLLPDARGIALDASPAALRRAARSHERAAAVGADAWKPLPLRDEIATTVLSVFAPRNGERWPASWSRPAARSWPSPPPPATSTSLSGRSACCRCPTTRRIGSTPSSPRTSRSRAAHDRARHVPHA